MDLQQFIAEFQDYPAPKLDTYDQAIYLYIFRHSRLIGLDEVTMGFKSARSRMACGNTAYIKLRSLETKKALSNWTSTISYYPHSG